MVFDPFKKTGNPKRRKWQSKKDYEKELEIFMGEHRRLRLGEVLQLWFEKPEHMGKEGYKRAKPEIERIIREERSRLTAMKRLQVERLIATADMAVGKRQRRPRQQKRPKGK